MNAFDCIGQFSVRVDAEWVEVASDRAGKQHGVLGSVRVLFWKTVADTNLYYQLT